MKWKPYPSYKPSGVEWLGEVPAPWVTPPLYTRYSIDLGKMLDEGRITGAHLVPYLRNVDVQWDRINFEDLPEIDVAPSERDRFTLRAGDLLVCEGGEVGRAAIVPTEGAGFAYQKALHRMRALRPSLDDARFVFYLLSAAASSGVFLAEGNPNTIPHLTGEKLRRYRFPMPTAQEQTAIARFLDHTTARLDALVAKKRALIERLREKRIALISRTVTRGLPPEAARAAGLAPHPKLKPSGIPWLGDIPEHWRVAPVKRVAAIGNGSTPQRDNEAYWTEGTYPWLTSTVVNEEAVTSAAEFVTERALRDCHLPRIMSPAVLVGITGEGRTRGMATTLRIEATINQHIAFLKPRPNDVAVDYLRRVLDRAYPYLRNESDGGGSTKGAITCEQLGELAVPLPPLTEQQAIAEYLDRETARIDRLVEKVEAAIERLQEYRQALITAAVTGKIDVRELPDAAEDLRT